MGTFSSLCLAKALAHGFGIMTHETEIPDSAIARPIHGELQTSDDSRRAFPARAFYDLAQGDGFDPDYTTPHLPVAAAFGAERLHQCRRWGAYDLGRVIAENPNALFRSTCLLSNDNKADMWDDLTFRFGPRSFLFVEESRMVGFAETPNEAERLVSMFSKKYSKPAKPTGGRFYLIKSGDEISVEGVPLGEKTILNDESFRLHYGEAGLEWHQVFTTKLSESNHGLSILEGRPGTGKTSYLRHLMGVLKTSHRFYFIPTSTMSVLSDPNFIGFWTEQRRDHPDSKFVVILEDSDAALMTRGSDNREEVSALLNISDGMLGDFLRLQIICTINCRAADIDQALLRPGRLLCHRVFGKLDYAQASRLAESLGRKLPVARDYSLAEVFAGHDAVAMERPRIGFAA